MAHEVHRVRPWDSLDVRRLIARFRGKEYRHDPVDIADDSIFETLFDRVKQKMYKPDSRFKFEDRLERTVRSLSVLRPDRHFAVVRARIVDGNMEAFRFWMYFQNTCIIEEVADLGEADASEKWVT